MAATPEQLLYLIRFAGQDSYYPLYMVFVVILLTACCLSLKVGYGIAGKSWRFWVKLVTGMAFVILGWICGASGFVLYLTTTLGGSIPGIHFELWWVNTAAAVLGAILYFAELVAKHNNTSFKLS